MMKLDVLHISQVNSLGKRFDIPHYNYLLTLNSAFHIVRSERLLPVLKYLEHYNFNNYYLIT